MTPDGPGVTFPLPLGIVGKPAQWCVREWVYLRLSN